MLEGKEKGERSRCCLCLGYKSRYCYSHEGLECDQHDVQRNPRSVGINSALIASGSRKLVNLLPEKLETVAR